MDLTSRLFPDPLHQFGTPRSAPPPGSAKPGNLYADLQSRTLWLGVDASIDPAQAVLVSDIISLTDAIVEAEADANAYTDAQLLTRAPLVHTHTASQITDLDDAIEDAVNNIPGFAWVKGMIIMYSGSLAEIGTGNLAGWALCDGANGTPDLRDRFIIGAGNKAVGDKNDGKAVSTGNNGAHTHVINSRVLTEAQMPQHYHTFTGTFSAYTNLSGAHTHNYYSPNFSAGRAGGGYNTAGASDYVATAGGGDHNHYVTGPVSGNTSYVGGSTGHDHTMNSAGDHAHSIPANTLRDGLAYYAAAFIMKL